MELESPPPLEIGSDSSDAMAQQCLNVTARGRALARGPAAQEQLAACKDTSKANSERACLKRNITVDEVGNAGLFLLLKGLAMRALGPMLCGVKAVPNILLFSLV